MWTRESPAVLQRALATQPKAWPNGARVAVLLSFDVDNETVALRYGDPTPGSLSQAQYGARVGLERIVNLLDAHKIPATFFIPSVSLALTPTMADVIKKSGRRAPSWNFSPNTLSLLREIGFRYESSLMADDRPYELLQDGMPTGIVDIPVEWILDDAPLFDPRGERYSPPREVAKVSMDEFDKAYDPRRRRVRPHTGRPQSARSAIVGSTLAARIAGTRLAATAHTNNTPLAPNNTSGSLGATLNNIDAISRPPASASTTPVRMPANTGISPRVIVSSNKSVGRAPSAVRTPSSCIR